MQFFEKYYSNSLAGSGNQSFYLPENPNEVRTARLFFKIFKGGLYHYSILFSNTIDSTFSDGSFSHKNIVCDEWFIDSMRLGICDTCNCETMVNIDRFHSVTFNGNITKSVMPGEFFSTDEILLDLRSNQFICLEIAYHGPMIPCHPESLIPTFSKENDKWVPSKDVPVPSMIGCDRPISKRIAYLGDSITQGIGTPHNAYTAWNCLLSDHLGNHNGYWNLGLGFGRADDAASDGAWLFKAKQADTVIVCFGVNDIHKGFTQECIQKNLKTIAEILSKNGIRVIIQTVPPFDYNENNRITWENINNYIKTVLAQDYEIFDNVPILSVSYEFPYNAKYGGHPNEKGCALWAEKLYEQLKNTL